MDNLSHSLIGAVLAETALRWLPAAKSALPPPTRRALFFTLTVAGSNVPDLDLLYTGFLPGNLGYLLHHRGHTHTVIGALVAAMLMLGICFAWLRWRSIATAARDRRELLALSLLGPLLHIAMDAANNYGVHPFWPFDNDWFYGDSIFIVEPLLWASAAPLVFLLQRRLTRGVVATVLAIALVLAFFTGLVPRPLAWGLALLIVGLLLLGWRASARMAMAGSVIAAVGVVAVFVTASHVAGERVAAVAAAQFPQARLLDSVLTPMPVDPLCWDVILVQLEQDNYTLRQFTLSLAPGRLPATACPSLNGNLRPTAPFAPVDVADSAAVYWGAQITMSRAQLQTLVANHCDAAAFVRYARALWMTGAAESRWSIADLRFNRGGGPGFAGLTSDATTAECPSHVPPWNPPRSDVLSG